MTTAWILALAVAAAPLGQAFVAVNRSAVALASRKFSWRSVVAEHERYSRDVDVRRFGGETLVYVTPWNSHGYDVAKRFGSKFDYVSPVWLQIRSSPEGLATLTGLHDIDQGWVTDVRRACDQAALLRADEDDTGSHSTQDRADGRRREPACPRIVPRVVWEAQALSSAELSRAHKLIVDVCESAGFDGVVLEAVPPHPTTVPFVRELAAALHTRVARDGRPLVLIYVVSPAAIADSASSSSSAPTAAAALRAMVADGGVDRLSLMTYDYSSSRGRVGPNAPLHWVRETTLRLLHAISTPLATSDSHPAPSKSEDAPTSRTRLSDDTSDGSLSVDAASGDVESTRLSPADRELAQRIMVGVAMYGYRDDGAGRPEAIVGRQYLEMLQTNKPKMLWDPKSEEHLFKFAGSRPSQAALQCWYPTLFSVQRRLELAESLGVGVAVWEVGQGLDYFYDLF